MIENRQHLIQWLTKNVTDRVLNNALESGQIENFGLFNPLPTSKAAGFIVRVTSVNNSTYDIAVAIGVLSKHRWFRVKDFSWADWMGDKAAVELFQGDRPKVYGVLKWGVKNCGRKNNTVARKN